jgi:hypothetical protein
MHIGLTQPSAPSSTTSASKSVGQRLKDASGWGKDSASVANGASANHNAKGARTGQQESAERTLRMQQPVILSELQKNTVRVIGQYLRELGMQ